MRASSGIAESDLSLSPNGGVHRGKAREEPENHTASCRLAVIHGRVDSFELSLCGEQLTALAKIADQSRQVEGLQMHGFVGRETRQAISVGGKIGR